MELQEGIETRQSYRAYKPDLVPEEVVRDVLTMARRAPSYMNTQPWLVAAVSGAKKKELGQILLDLARSGQPGKTDIPAPQSWPEEHEARFRTHAGRRMEAIGVDRNDAKAREELRLANYDFYGAPCALFLAMDATLSSWSLFDMGLFAQSILLAAHAKGLGTCLQASVAGYPETVRKYLGIPEDRKIVIGIALGYPDTEAAINAYRSQRMDTAEFMTWYA